MTVVEVLRHSHRAWLFRLRKDRPEIRFVLRHARRGSTAIDVGAHKGAYTYWLRNRVGRAGTVWAFEPQPLLASMLRRIVAGRRWSNVHVVEAAVSDHAGRLPLEVPGTGETSPGARLVGAGTDVTPRAVSVDVVTLDEVLADRSAPVSVIKCDVEGAELSVFRGAATILREDRPALLFECEQRHHDTDTIDSVFDHLSRNGYRGSFFHRGALTPVDVFDVETHQPSDCDRFWDRPEYCSNFAFVATT